jgi:hypothetical protein
MKPTMRLHTCLTCGVCILRGPDTNNKRRFVRSFARREPSRFVDKNPGWLVKLYKGPNGMDKVPRRWKGFTFIGKGIAHRINMKDQNMFRSVVPNTPNENFVWVMSGTLRVVMEGTYKLCTKSDDGSKLYLNGKRVVNNDGLHGPEQKCSDVKLTSGRHAVTATGFQRGGGAYMEVTYK